MSGGRPASIAFGEQVAGPPIGVLPPGPVWHVSVHPLRRFYGATLCGQRAEQALAGLGDPTLGEWREWSGYAYHLRRRLTAAEQNPIGPAIDIRGTPEALRRFEAIPKHLRTYIPADVLAEEIRER